MGRAKEKETKTNDLCRFNFLLEEKLKKEDIYTVLLPKNTKILNLYEFQQEPGGHHITEYNHAYVWNTPYMLCERASGKVDTDNLEERSFILINSFDIETINKFTKTVYVDSIERKSFTTANIFFLFEIKEK